LPDRASLGVKAGNCTPLFQRQLSVMSSHCNITLASCCTSFVSPANLGFLLAQRRKLNGDSRVRGNDTVDLARVQEGSTRRHGSWPAQSKRETLWGKAPQPSLRGIARAGLGR
jgi:hypothetical protein